MATTTKKQKLKDEKTPVLNKLYAISDFLKEISNKQNNLIITGSAALILRDVPLKRDIDDIDIIIVNPTQYQRNLFNLWKVMGLQVTKETYGNRSPSLKMQIKDVTVNIFKEYLLDIDAFTLFSNCSKSLQIEGKDYHLADISSILEAKLSYVKVLSKDILAVRTKDLDDVTSTLGYYSKIINEQDIKLKEFKKTLNNINENDGTIEDKKPQTGS